MSQASDNRCCQCGDARKLKNLYGYKFCSACESKLGLHQDKTILKNAERFAATKDHSYEQEVVQRLQTMERDFATTKVKLMHILERLNELA